MSGFPFAKSAALLAVDAAFEDLGRKKKRKGDSFTTENESEPKKILAAKDVVKSAVNISNSLDDSSLKIDNMNVPDDSLTGIKSIDGRSVLLIVPKTTIFYISGFCRATLLKGSASLNGYQLNMNIALESIYFPSWLPASRLHASGRKTKTSSSSGASSSAAILSTLAKADMLSYFPMLHKAYDGKRSVVEDKGTGKSQSNCSKGKKGKADTDTSSSSRTVIVNVNKFESAIDSSNCVILIESLDENKMPWLVSAEDKSQYFQSTNMDQTNTSDADTHTHAHDIIHYDYINLGTVTIGTSLAITQKGINLTRIPPTWITACDKLLSFQKAQQQQLTSQSLKTLICGAKGVGKSTCLRYTINRLLSSSASIGISSSLSSSSKANQNCCVCVLDCDVGQPEYSLPGTISLVLIKKPNLSPPHLHCHSNNNNDDNDNYNDSGRIILQSYYIGDITTKNSSDRIKLCVKHLIEKYESIRLQVASGDTSILNMTQHEYQSQYQYQSELPASRTKSSNSSRTKINANPFGMSEVDVDFTTVLLPLIVNTDGFIRYMGSEILYTIVTKVQPNYILQIVSNKDKNIYALNEYPKELILSLECGSTQPSTTSSLDLRNLRITNYFLNNTYSNEYLKKYVNANNNNNNELNEDVMTVSGLGSWSDDDTIYIRNGTLVDKNNHISKVFCSMQPWLVSTCNTSLGCIAGEIPSHLVLAVMNASLVGICTSTNYKSIALESEDEDAYRNAYGGKNENDSGSGSGSSDSSDSSTKMRIRMRQESHDDDGNIGMSPCLGVGVVRSIDLKNEQLHLLCPVNISSYIPPSNTICLIRGSAMTLPAFLIFSKTMPCHPYMTNDSAGDGALQTKARNNVKRRTYQQK
jgi:polynucleotide 5'-kinase involved in rRNA processing